MVGGDGDWGVVKRIGRWWSGLVGVGAHCWVVERIGGWALIGGWWSALVADGVGGGGNWRVVEQICGWCSKLVGGRVD